MITGELKSQVDKIWEAFWTGGISNPISVIEQFTYLLFIRRLDEEQLKEEKKAALVGIPMKKVLFTEGQKPLRWNQFKNEDPETMFGRFTSPTVEGMSVFDHMKQVGDQDGVFAGFMSKATFIISTPRLLDQVVQLIDGVDMEDRDTKGDLYEYMLSKIASAGTNGQFRTPRHIIRMMVDMVQPKKDDVICDPAAGTSGFLVTASEYFHDNHEEWFHEEGFRKHFQNDMFHGIEVDPTMARIGAMNLQLHGIENPQLATQRCPERSRRGHPQPIHRYPRQSTLQGQFGLRCSGKQCPRCGQVQKDRAAVPWLVPAHAQNRWAVCGHRA